MTCGTETNCGTRSDARDNRGRGDCCCLYCQEVIGDCVTGCACLAKRLCVRFFPDDPSLATGYATYVYDENGQYVGSPANFGLSVEIVHDEYGERQWHFTSGSVTPALDEYVPVSEVGCNGSLTEDGVILSVGGLTTTEGDTGTLVAAVYERQVIPLVTDESGCTDILCTGCSCIPHCLCVMYVFRIQDPEVTDPHDPDFIEVSVRQRVLVCYDPDLRGWHYTFPEYLCAPEKEVLIKIAPDDTGVCSLLLNTTSYDNEHTDEEPLSSLDCDSFGGTWQLDLLGGDNYETTIVASDGDCSDCHGFCCQYRKDTLTATVQGRSSDDGPCTDPFEVTLSLDSAAPCKFVYKGSALFDWVCDDDGPDTFRVDLTCVVCGGAVYFPKDEVCKCPCSGSEDPFTSGCASLTLDIVDPDGGPDFGGPANTFAICGVFEGVPVQSVVDPHFHKFYIPLQGFADCCDKWYVTVTE